MQWCLLTSSESRCVPTRSNVDFDVPGILVRDLDKLGSFATKWYGDRVSKESAGYDTSHHGYSCQSICYMKITPRRKGFHLNFLKTSIPSGTSRLISVRTL